MLNRQCMAILHDYHLLPAWNGGAHSHADEESVSLAHAGRDGLRNGYGPKGSCTQQEEAAWTLIRTRVQDLADCGRISARPQCVI